MPDDRADTDDLRFNETYDSPPCSGRRKANHRGEIDIGGPAVVLQGSQQRQVDLVDFGTHFADRPDYVADHLESSRALSVRRCPTEVARMRSADEFDKVTATFIAAGVNDCAIAREFGTNNTGKS